MNVFTYMDEWIKRPHCIGELYSISYIIYNGKKIYIKTLDHFGVQQNEHNVNQLHFDTN